MPKRPLSLPKLRTVPKQCSGVDQRLVREPYIEQLSHAAGALDLFLVTVADAQGRSFSAERSLCQRVSMPLTVLRQARQALLTRALVASHSPLSQVLALGGDARGPATACATRSADDEPVDLQAVFTHIWEVLS